MCVCVCVCLLILSYVVSLLYISFILRDHWFYTFTLFWIAESSLLHKHTQRVYLSVCLSVCLSLWLWHVRASCVARLLYFLGSCFPVRLVLSHVKHIKEHKQRAHHEDLYNWKNIWHSLMYIKINGMSNTSEKLHHLHFCEPFLPRAWYLQSWQEVIAVHENVYERIE